MRKVKILYIDGVGPFGGASRSLIEVAQRLEEDYDSWFLAARGTAGYRYKVLADKCLLVAGLSRFDNTAYSYYRGFRWLIVLREVFFLPWTFFSILWIRFSWGVPSLVHVNEITEIIPGVFSKIVFRCPLIVHVRSVQRGDEGYRTKFIRLVMNCFASQVIAIDEVVAHSLVGFDNLKIIHNSFSARESRVSKSDFLEKYSISSEALIVGFVGNLQVSKGIFELVDAISKCRTFGLNVALVIAGGYSRKKNVFLDGLLTYFGLAQNRHNELELKLSDLSDCVIRLGEVDEISDVYSNIDLICFPSYFNAPGRPIFEAAFYGKPSISCISSSWPDTFVGGRTGISVEVGSSEGILSAIRTFYEDREILRFMGDEAKLLAVKNFSPEKNFKKVISVYSSLLEGCV